jgi:hypothetical protein
MQAAYPTYENQQTYADTQAAYLPVAIRQDCLGRSFCCLCYSTPLLSFCLLLQLVQLCPQFLYPSTGGSLCNVPQCPRRHVRSACWACTMCGCMCCRAVLSIALLNPCNQIVLTLSPLLDGGSMQAVICVTHKHRQQQHNILQSSIVRGRMAQHHACTQRSVTGLQAGLETG